MEKKFYICTFVFLKEILFYETGMSGMMDSTPEGKKKTPSEPSSSARSFR